MCCFICAKDESNINHIINISKIVTIVELSENRCRIDLQGDSTMHSLIVRHTFEEIKSTLDYANKPGMFGVPRIQEYNDNYY